MKHTPLPMMMCNMTDRLGSLEPRLETCRRDHRLEGAYTGNDHAARIRGQVVSQRLLMSTSVLSTQNLYVSQHLLAFKNLEPSGGVSTHH